MARITLRQAGEVRDIPLDHPALSAGWHKVERDGASLRRWTDGRALLLVPAASGPRMLEIRAGIGELEYVSVEPAALAA